MCNWSNPKSYNKPCVLIAFPGFWVVVSYDPDLGTAFDSACYFCWLSIHVGPISYAGHDSHKVLK